MGINPDAKRFVKLKKLKCYPEVERRLKERYTLVEIARYIQEEREELNSMKRQSVENLLSDYRETFPPTELVARNLPQSFINAEKKLEDGLDELEAMKKIYELQLSRVEVFIENDIGTMFPNKDVTSDIKLLMDILSNRATLKMDLGINDRSLGKMSIEANIMAMAEERFGRKAAEVLTNPESRRKVISIVDRLSVLKKRQEEERRRVAIDAESKVVGDDQ